MIKRNSCKKNFFSLLPLVGSLLVFALVSILVVVGLCNTKNTADSEGIRIAEESIRRAVICCYAIEGYYPADYAYLRNNYQIMVDEDSYYVDYQIFSSNIMPQITVIPVENRDN